MTPEETKDGSSSRRRVRLGVLCALLLGLTALFADYVFYPWHARMPGNVPRQSENGVWLRDDWYFGRHTDAEVRQLAHDLSRRRMRFAYFHARYIGKSGKLRYRLPAQASHLNVTLKRESPGIKRIAWVYIGNTRGAGSIRDFGDADYRRRAVAEAQFLVSECGFDGVQWDYEICPDGDAGFLSLLAETRAALPPGAILSVASALWSPGLPRAAGHGWGDAYFALVAARSDQICVMGYDSGLYLPRAYAWLMQEQVTHVCRAAGGTRCRVLIGTPTYDAGGLSHHAKAENLSVAMRGVCAGYAGLSLRDRESFGGIALFADYTTDDGEWRIYQRDWLGER